jgi:hypothetical protein
MRTSPRRWRCQNSRTSHVQCSFTALSPQQFMIHNAFVTQMLAYSRTLLYLVRYRGTKRVPQQFNTTLWLVAPSTFGVLVVDSRQYIISVDSVGIRLIPARRRNICNRSAATVASHSCGPTVLPPILPAIIGSCVHPELGHPKYCQHCSAQKTSARGVIFGGATHPALRGYLSPCHSLRLLACLRHHRAIR